MQLTKKLEKLVSNEPKVLRNSTQHKCDLTDNLSQKCMTERSDDVPYKLTVLEDKEIEIALNKIISDKHIKIEFSDDLPTDKEAEYTGLLGMGYPFTGESNNGVGVLYTLNEIRKASHNCVPSFQFVRKGFSLKNDPLTRADTYGLRSYQIEYSENSQGKIIFAKDQVNDLLRSLATEVDIVNSKRKSAYKSRICDSEDHGEDLYQDIKIESYKTGKPIALINIDLSALNNSNYHVGQPGDDSYLRNWRHHFRKTDGVTTRFRGRELVAILPNTDLEGVMSVLQRAEDSFKKSGVKFYASFGSFPVEYENIKDDFSSCEYLFAADDQLSVGRSWAGGLQDHLQGSSELNRVYVGPKKEMGLKNCILGIG